MYHGPRRDLVAWNPVLLYDMACTQPVTYELGQLYLLMLLLIGQKDTAAIGKNTVPSGTRAQLGHCPELGHAAAKAIPYATLVKFSNVDHTPQIQGPNALHNMLPDWLVASEPSRTRRLN